MLKMAVFGEFLVALVFAGVTASRAVDVRVITGGDRVVKPVKSFKELREQGVVLQKLDYSCGAAALATVFTHHFKDRVEEPDIIGFIFVHGQTPEEGLKKYFRRQGFSLLDLKKFAEFRGYKVAGFKEMELEDLVELLWLQRLPVLVPVNPFGYNHFVVLTGIGNNRVFYADPPMGHMSMTLARFSDVWVGGIGLVVSKTEIGRATPGQMQAGELGRVTEAGSATLPKSESSETESSLLATGDEVGAPDVGRVMVGLERRQQSIVQPRYLQTFGGDRGNVLSRFEIQKYNPVIQFGDPAGNFIDFTPPAGRPIIVRE
jgi:hypothetical protein